MNAKNKLIWVIILILTLIGCAEDNGDNSSSSDKKTLSFQTNVIQDTRYGAVLFDLSTDAMNKMGFNYGDSVDVVLSSGFTKENVPYYNGFYGKTGDWLLCGYTPASLLSFTMVNKATAWTDSNATADTTATVTLRGSGTYHVEQEAMNLTYTDNSSDYDTLEIFGNFREIKGGSLSSNKFYRSASPCGNKRKRAAVVDDLAEQYGVSFIIDLSDTTSDIAGFMSSDDFNSPYFKSLYESDKVMPLGLTMGYRSEDYAKTIGESLIWMTNQTGKGLTHCLEGKDRTGFFCILLLALSNASDDEITDDYMITYENYYHLTKTDDKYNAIVKMKVGDFFDYLKGLSAAGTVTDGAKAYLKMGGITDSQITSIVSWLTN